jgi:hypothetical protein
MKKSTKSKWIVGLAGTAFSAFVLSQIGVNNANQQDVNKDSLKIDPKVYATMDDREKELVQLDWSNFTISEPTMEQGAMQSDRKTRRS